MTGRAPRTRLSRRHLLLLGGCAAVLLFGLAIVLGAVRGPAPATPPSAAAGPKASFPRKPCRPKPLAGVYSSDRLKLISPCRAIVGTVQEPFTNGDGDQAFNLAPDPAYTMMLNDANRTEGGLHIEIVPADQPGCAKGENVPPIRGFESDDLGICTGASVVLPKEGDHVRVVGALVLDPGNDWREIHPTWQIRKASKAS